MHKKLLAAVALCALALTACGDDSSSSGGGGGKDDSKTIGLLYQLKAAEISVRGGDNFNEAADALGWKLIETDPAGDPAKAATGLANFATQNVDAAIVAAWEPEPIRQGLTKLEAADIPAVNVFGGISSTDGFQGQIAPDESAFGAAAADEFFKGLKAGDKVAKLNSTAFTFGALRDAEFQKKAEEVGVEVVADHQTDYTNPQADTVKAITDILNANPDVDGIWTDSSLQVPGVAQVLEEKGLCGKVDVVGFYGDIGNIQAVRDGCVTTIVDVPLQAQAWATMDALAANLYDGDDLPTELPTTYPFDLAQIQVINADNLPEDPKAYIDLDYDYKAYFTKKWDEGDYGAPS